MFLRQTDFLHSVSMGIKPKDIEICVTGRIMSCPFSYSLRGDLLHTEK